MDAALNTSTDLATHRIEGYARAAEEAGKDGHFSVPLVTHVEGNLWQGGCRDGVRLPDDFEFVVSLYPWEKFTLGERTTRWEFELYDAQEMPEEGMLRRAAEAVNEFRAKGKTLVHCQAGLNRSGLVTAYALILSGYPPADAIDLLRRTRCPMVLCNETFEEWLHGRTPSRAAA